MTARVSANGFLGQPKTAGYVPHVYGGLYWGLNSQRPPFLLQYIEQMREDPQVQFGLRAIYGSLTKTKAVCTHANSATVKHFVTVTLQQLIKRCMPALRQCIEYGHAAGEPSYVLRSEKLHFNRLKDWHPLDVQPMVLDGKLVGVRVKNVKGVGTAEVGAPRYVWVANEPRPGSFWGRSRLACAWVPWMEKTGRNAALDIRRLHFFKNSIRGDQLYYPVGETNAGTFDNPQNVNNQDLARQICEQMFSGGTLALPNTKNADNSDYDWVVKGPQSVSPPEGLLDWIKDLDNEILKGLGVPPEVLQASPGTGLSQGGRAIPLDVFFAMLDEQARQIVEALDRHILRWLVRANFGRNARYEIDTESLAPQPPPQPGAGPSGRGAPPKGPPGRPGSNRSPYVGPRGGRGWKLPSGRVKYGMSRADRDWAVSLSRRPSLRDRLRRAGRRTDTRHLAQFYASLWNLLLAAGQSPPESEIEKAGAELARGRWVVAFDRRRGKWITYPAAPDENRVQMSTEHAPPGGVTLAGKWFKGGQFIPSAVIANLPPAERAKLAQAKQTARDNLRTRAEPHVAGLRERLSAYGGEKLDRKAGKHAEAALAQLQRHHGELTRHRLAELTHFLESALEKTPADEEGLRAQFKQRLAVLHRMESGLEAHKPAEQASPATGPGKPGEVRNVPTKDLHVDAARFQYKLGTNKKGVGPELQSVESFNPELAGVLSVWHDPADGKNYVVNGHHRYELASRKNHPAMDVRYLNAKDAKEARAKGALINIAEGRGTPVDAAKFMRDTGYTPDDLAREGISLSGNVARDAVSLAKLSDGLFNRVATGEMDTAKAAAIGSALDDHGLQDQLAKWIEKKEEKSGREYSPRVVAEMAREIAATPKTSKTEATLWGDESTEESLFGERNELKAFVRGELAKEHKDFATVASERRAGVVGRAGNVLNVEANKAAATEAGQAKNTYDTLVNLKGPVSDVLNDFAEKFSHAKGNREREAVRKDAVAAVRSALSQAQPPGTEGVGEGGAGARGAEPGEAAGGGGTGRPLTEAEKEARLAEHAATVAAHTPAPLPDDADDTPAIKRDRIAAYQSEYPESLARERAAAKRIDRESGHGDVEPVVARFKTAKGSTYEVHTDGTTTRTKSDHSAVGHDATDTGKKEKSVKTVYVPADIASALSSAGMADNPKARVVIKDGKAALLIWNDKEGKWGITESMKSGVPVADKPAVGLAPLELWHPKGDVPGLAEAYGGMHAGNAITEIGDVEPARPVAPAAKPEPMPSAAHVTKEGDPAEQAHDEYRSLVKDIRTLPFDELRQRFGKLAEAPKGVLAGVAQRLGFTTDGTKEQLAKRLLGNLEGIKVSASQVDRIGRERPAATPEAQQPAIQNAPETDPLDITPESVEGVWKRNRDDIVGRNPKLSPAAAGSLAAARILNAVNQRAGQFIDEIDAKVKRGEQISDADDAKYIAAGDLRRNLYQKLVDLSGYRPHAEGDEHPEAKAPLVGGTAPKETPVAQMPTAAAVPESHAPVGSETADLSNQFHMLEVGQLGYVGGYPVRRTGRREYRLETDKHHVTGTMEEVTERIRRHWADQKPERKAVDAALARAATYTDPNPFTDAAGSERDDKARQNLPTGTRVVSLDPETRGRVGTVKVVTDADGNRKQTVTLDNSPDSHASDFEPLNAAASWRSGEKPAEAPAPPKPVQQPLFGETPTAPEPPKPPKPPPEAQLEQRIHAALGELSGGDERTRVRIADLRRRLPDVPADELTAAVRQLSRRRAVTMYPYDNPRNITPEDEAAAIHSGSGVPQHVLYYGGIPSETPAPTAPATAPAAQPYTSIFDRQLADRFAKERGPAGQTARDLKRLDLTKRLGWDKDPANVAAIHTDLNGLTAIDGKTVAGQRSAVEPPTTAAAGPPKPTRPHAEPKGEALAKYLYAHIRQSSRRNHGTIPFGTFRLEVGHRLTAKQFDHLMADLIDSGAVTLEGEGPTAVIRVHRMDNLGIRTAVRKATGLSRAAEPTVTRAEFQTAMTDLAAAVRDRPINLTIAAGAVQVTTPPVTVHNEIKTPEPPAATPMEVRFTRNQDGSARSARLVPAGDDD